jgi:hypothetical protein
MAIVVEPYLQCEPLSQPLSMLRDPLNRVRVRQEFTCRGVDQNFTDRPLLTM